MTDSQKHRPAVSVTMSEASRLKKQLIRAENLEEQLTKVAKDKDDKAAKLRSRLCEIYADVLIADPNLGLDKDCVGRLWRLCFYTPLGVLRSRVSREKRKKGPNLVQYDKAMKKFLQEALQLYDYLIGRYQSKLLPPASDGGSNTGGSQNTESSSSQEDLSMSPVDQSQSPPSSPGGQNSVSSRWPPARAIVPVLHRLYIYTGDLHRYGESYTKAEQSYLSASKLAPGMGNPYNQLAVVSQVKDSNNTCVSLYWYARSILASHESFETSNSNLDRLFVTNRNYLKEHSRDPKAPILTQHAAANKNIDKKTAQEMMRAQKTAAIRSSLAHFVDLHDRFYQGPSNSSSDDDKNNHQTLEEKRTNMIESLESLLLASAFGDALLCKMVAITTFSVTMIQRKKQSVSPSDSGELSAAEEFLFQFGACLARRLAAGLGKLSEKKTGNNNNKKAPTSIRLLLPFLLLFEYIDHRMSNDIVERDDESFVEFWKQLTEVANLVVDQSKRFERTGTPMNVDSALFSLKEYRNLKGFHPFGFLFKEYASQEACVTPAEAAEVLELNRTQTQDSNASSVDDTHVKVSRILQLCQRSAKRPNVPMSLKSSGVFVLLGHPEPQEDDPMEAAEEPMDDTGFAAMEENQDPIASDLSPPMVMETDEAGDVVVYNAPATGDGPALLVPGGLVPSPPKNVKPTVASTGGNESATESRRSPLASVINEKRNPNAVVPVERGGPPQMEPDMAATNPNDIQVLPPPPGILPPPGFRVTATAAAPVGFVPAPGPAQTPYSPVVATPAMPPPNMVPMGMYTPQQPYAPTELFPGGGPPMMTAGFPPQYHTPIYGAAPAPGPTLGNSSEWFGGVAGLQTANPFFTKPPANLGLINNGYANSAGRFESEANSEEETSFLDSGLLSSLWGMDDNISGKTKNPFASNY